MGEFFVMKSYPCGNRLKTRGKADFSGNAIVPCRRRYDRVTRKMGICVGIKDLLLSLQLGDSSGNVKRVRGESSYLVDDDGITPVSILSGSHVVIFF